MTRWSASGGTALAALASALACSGVDVFPEPSAAGARAGAGAGGGAGQGGSGGSGASTGCRLVIEDRDGDGTTFVYSTCGIVVGESTEVSSYDCDDGDPNVDVTWYADRDADGYGSSSEVVCAPRGPIPTGFVLRGGDCDDSDLGRNPGRLDLPENGVDEDCDGADAGLCERGYEFCPCDQDLSDVEMSANCDGFDLAIVERVTCEFSCQFEDFVWLGNLGTQAFEGELSLGSGEQSFTLRGPLAAGTVVGPLSVPFRLLATGEPLLVEASVSGDCNPENNTTLSRAASGIRPLCL